MAETTIPTTPVTQTSGTPTNDVQDLQINLAEAPKTDSVQSSDGNLQKSSANPQESLDLDLDLNLPEAPKNDDRLKVEDQKNTEATIEQPAAEVVVTETPVMEKTVETPAVAVEIPMTETQVEPIVTEIPVAEKSVKEVSSEIIGDNHLQSSVLVEEKMVEEVKSEVVAQPTPEIKSEEVVVEKIAEPTTTEVQPAPGDLLHAPDIVEHPATTVEEIPTQPTAIAGDISTSSEIIGSNPQKSSSLQSDINMINELEGHPSAGGLALEAVVPAQPAPTETPKTFDLDSMLGTVVPPTTKTTEVLLDKGGNEGGFVTKAEEIPQPQVLPAFTIPTTTTQVPIQAIIQTHVPNKNSGVKVLLFTVMFIALGFTTFFILKTMYPVEFGNIFGGQTQLHASADLTGTIDTGMIDSGTMDTGIIDTGITDTGVNSTGDAAFGELNDLGTAITQTETPPQTDLSKLTDYVNQGTAFLAQGKTMENNTVIKYGLYISKKATSFLEKIANGEQINNLSGYFAQFDQYLAQLNVLVGQSADTSTSVSATPPANGLQEVTTETTATPQDTGVTSE